MNRMTQTGFSLVELLIAMLISLTLIFACASVYSSLRNSITISQGLSNAQESLRGAHYLLSRSVRQGHDLQISSVATSPSIVVTYGEQANTNDFYGCLSEIQRSGATDTFFVKEAHLYCTTVSSDPTPVTTTEIIALDVQSLSASLSTLSKKGVDVNLVIKGMPGDTTGTMGKDGFTFSLAMRQRILIDSGITGASSASLHTGL